MGPIGCPETSVWNYHYSLRISLEERISHSQIVFTEPLVSFLKKIQINQSS